MMEKTPPPGKTWITVETDGTTVPSGWPIVHVEKGPEPEHPSDKCNRLLGEAETWFRGAADALGPNRNIADAPSRMLLGCRHLADALKVFREEL